MIAWESDLRGLPENGIQRDAWTAGCVSILPIKAHEAKSLPNSLSVQPCRFSVMIDRSAGMSSSDGISSECSVAVTATVSGTGSGSES